MLFLVEKVNHARRPINTKAVTQPKPNSIQELRAPSL
jgi:hypothetical protein